MATHAHPRLNPASPAAGLHAKARPDPGHSAQRRTLSDKQRRLPFFARALERLQAISAQRHQRLPRLAGNNPSGRITRIEVYANLAAAAEPILARLDLATSVLGWLDEHGHFRLNTQRGIARDSELAPACFNRLLKHLEQAGYLVRRLELIPVREHGEQFVRTRVLIRFADLFWQHLGLSLHHLLARKAARKRRLKQIETLQQTRLRCSTQQATRRRQKQASQRATTATKAPTPVAELHHRLALILQLRAQNPTLDAATINAMADAILSGNSNND